MRTKELFVLLLLQRAFIGAATCAATVAFATADDDDDSAGENKMLH